MLETRRLLLRQWRRRDFAPFARMCADAEVMRHFPNCLSQEESHQMANRITDLINERGWGLWAVEVPEVHNFIGFVGLHAPTVNFPFSPCVEVGWRLAREHWGNGYATEAATAALDYAFTRLQLYEVVSFTTTANTGSMAVMRRIGMRDTGENFMHPGIDPSHPQCEHVLYKITRASWLRRLL